MSVQLLLRRSLKVVETSSFSSRNNLSSVINPTSSSFNRLSIRNYATPSDEKFLNDLKNAKEAEAKKSSSSTNSNSNSNPSPSTSSSDPTQQSPSLAPLPKSFSMDVDMPEPELPAISDGGEGGKGKGGRTGAKAKKTQQSSGSIPGGGIGFALISTGALAMLGYNYGREFQDPVAIEMHKDNPLAKTWFGRIRLRLSNVSEEYSRPVWEVLLPDPLPSPYQRPYTLVLDLDDLLIHSSWSRAKGWQIAKRPGLDYFLGYLSQFYEIVIYTRQPFFTAEQVVDKLDPDKRKIMYSLFKEACRSHQGKLVKDLSSLNRDPKKVIILDTESDGFMLQPENGILVKPWKGEKGDRELMGLLNFLETIGIYGIPDVRTTIAAYSGTHIPTEHARRQAAIKQQETRPKASGMKLFGSGIREPSSATKAASWFDTERKRYQDGYAEDEKYWKENGDAFRQQAKEEQERQIKEMKMSAWGFLTGAAGAPPTAAEGQQPQQSSPPSSS